jgi:hypothetical protein
MVMSASISLWLRRPPARVRPPSSRLIHILGNAVCSLRWRTHYNLPGAINRRSGPRLTRQEFSFADHSMSDAAIITAIPMANYSPPESNFSEAYRLC